MGEIKPRDYWTEEKVKDIASKITKKSEFYKQHSGAYQYAASHNLLEEICSHMTTAIKPNGYWSKEKCGELAALCESKSEFKNKYSSAYGAAYKNNWLNDICSHMIEGRKPNGYLSKEKCGELAALCESRSEFKNKYSSAYSKSLKQNWIDEICSHMIYIGNKFKRLIYIYEFTDNHVYVGLTYNIKERNNEHLNVRGSVYKYIQKTKLIPKLSYGEYLDIKIAIELEGSTVEKYKKDGWIILNEIKTGGVGGNELKWSHDTVFKEALKYETKKEFEKISSGAYDYAKRHKILNDVCSHMIEGRKPNGYWNKELCHEQSIKFNTRNDFKKNSGAAYDYAKRNKFLDEICSHMIRLQHEKGYWTKERAGEIAKNYETPTLLRKHNASAYHAAYKNGWLNEFYKKN